MKFYADLHIHSSYSRATSKQLTPENLHAWGQLKGIGVVGTGDCLHPAWLAECQKKFHDEGNGLFSLKREFAAAMKSQVSPACAGDVRFMLTVEISNIYKKNGRVRKVHNVVCLPSFASVEKTVTRLERIGNLKSDGRPILGLDSRDLLEIVLEADPRAILIPAHIWTPWFSALGSKSGFDSIEECYGDLTNYIYAVETGLSSDPPMNWRLSSLDPFALVSFSDAHSPSKLGRECTIFDTDLSYDGIFRALSNKNDAGLAGTVEFFPEEGKYHVDGHRKCGVRCMPEETIARKGLCPECGKPLTIGVMSRVEELADRKAGQKAPRGRPFKSLVPLCEIIAEALDTGPDSKRAVEMYRTLLAHIGSEFSILLDTDIDAIDAAGGPIVAEGIRRVRSGEVTIAAGYDGEFGTVTIFSDADRKAIVGQENLFGIPVATSSQKPRKPSPASSHKKKVQNPADKAAPLYGNSPTVDNADPIFAHVNVAQKQAILHEEKHLLIVAGPGTGKTHTLTRRIAYRSRELPGGQSCCALTFTNKAAAEMKERLERLGAPFAFIGTIHAFCLAILREHSDKAGLSPAFEIASAEEIGSVIRQAWPDATSAKRRALFEELSCVKSCEQERPYPEFIRRYDTLLRSRDLIDFDTILQQCHGLLCGHPDVLAAYRQRYPLLFVDEYQDINGIQHAIIRLLAGTTGSVTAIGDPHQSIYGFRGSNLRFFNSFVDDFPGAQVLTLTENYRTAPTLLKAYGQVISRSSGKGVPPLVAALHLDGNLTIHHAPSGTAEAEYVVHEIEKLLGGTSMFSRDSGRVANSAEKERSFSDIAILYRTNSVRPGLEEALKRSGVPFTVSGEQPFYERESVAALLRLLRFAAGECLSAETVADLIGQTTTSFTPQKGTELIAGLGGARQQIDKAALSGLCSSSDRFPASLQRMVTPFLLTVRTVGDLLAAPDLPQAVALCETLPLWKNDCAASREAAEIHERLARIARTAASYREFMDTVLLQREEDGIGNRAEAVSLMTLHASKGLEWPVVFIIGCEDGIIPLEKKQGAVDPEEERRLLYVGMSRAQELLYLTSAERRFRYGHEQPSKPSPFLADIEDSLKNYDRRRSSGKKGTKPDGEQLSLF